GPVVAFQLAGNRARTRLAVVGDGATLWLLAGGAGAPLRPQRELGVAAAAAGHQAGRGRTRSRTGDGRRHPASRRPAARRSPAGDGPPATGTSAGPDRKRAPGTGPDGGANRKGTGSSTC